jgi:hypothetical protein
MTRFTKIAVSVPTETYRAVEKARARLGKSRSAAVASALDEWLRGLAAGEAARRYVEGYLRQPESREELAVTAAFAHAAVADWPAWEPAPPSRAGEPRAPAGEPRTRARRARSRR